MKVSNEQQGTANRLAGSTAQKLCGCGLQANSSVVTPAAAGGAEDSCSYLAWQLVVLPGQNKFDMAFTTVRPALGVYGGDGQVVFCHAWEPSLGKI